MINLFLSFVIAVTAAALPWKAFAETKQIDFTKADQLIKKYNVQVERPKSCPMESKRFSDLVAKTDAIKDVLKGNCLKKESDKMTEVLESIKSIQDELKNNSSLGALTASTSTTTTTTTASNENAINGLKFSALFSNITTMFKKNQCSMEDGRVLEMTADLIYDSTQLGLISGSSMGLAVAGGGFIVSSALRLIDLLIKKRFDFEKATDRQSFVKLNCSFYDIRRELDAQGALDIENSTSREDYRDIKAVIEEVNAEIKKMDEDKASIAKTYSEMDKSNFKENIGDFTELKKILVKIQRYLQPGVNQAGDIPTETQKLLMMSQLAADYDVLTAQVKSYKTFKVSAIPMLDDLFLNELKKFDSLDFAIFSESMNISAKDFNENHRAKILFHIMRISNDISAKENVLAESNQKSKIQLSENMDKTKVAYLAKLAELKKVEARLGNLVAPKEYSGLDDGSDNMITIIENHKQISSQLYGEWGDKFMKYTTLKGFEEVKMFNERLNLFNTKYADIITNKSTDNVSTSYLCQDAQKLRLTFKHADSLVQEGFDFVLTNKDIIYSDVKNYYNGKINEDEKPGLLGPVEKVQRHYKSAIFALKKLKGEVVSKEDIDQYLNKTWGGSLYIGRAMLEVADIKAKARKVQDAYESLGCQKSLVEEL